MKDLFWKTEWENSFNFDKEQYKPEEIYTPESHPEWFESNRKTPAWDEFREALKKEILRLKEYKN